MGVVDDGDRELPTPARSLGGDTPLATEDAAHTASAASPLGALFFDELARTRLFLKLMMLVTVTVAVTLPFLGGHPVAKRVFATGISVAAIVIFWLLIEFRRPERFTRLRFVAGGIVLAVCAFSGVYYFGVYSPAPGILVLGIYFYSLGGSTGAVAGVYAACAILQLAAAALSLAGTIPDHGLIAAAGLSATEKLITQLLVQVLYLAAFVTARFSRKTMSLALSRLERAVMQVAQREALLREARQDLDRALRIGGPGRYTDQQLGAYKLSTLLGRGGMGEVYRAVHVDTGEPAAVKLLHARSLDNRDHVTRFFREVRAIASIDEPHVVSVMEVGSTDGEVPFFAMELLEGEDLAAILRRRRRLSIADVATLVNHIARGLHGAREAGIVHRDIKPQNLFLTRGTGDERVWKILDFGVSKLSDHHGTITRGQVVGTPGYMAPEQARGHDVDHRADLYALSAIAYRALTGQPPFSGANVPAALYDVVHGMPARPSALVDVPAEIDLVLAIGLAKKADDRFGSATELADAFERAGGRDIDPALRRRAESLLATMPWRV